MVIYDLLCTLGHAFEGWFDSSAEFHLQQEQGLLVCPVCGTADIERTPHASAMVSSRDATESAAQAGQQRLRELVMHMAATVRKHTEDVGSGFTDEALRIHHGEVPARAIRGVANPDDERTLQDEGVPYVKVLLPEPDA